MRARLMWFLWLFAVAGCAKPELEEPSFIDGDAPADSFSQRLEYRGSLAYGETVEAEYGTSGYAGYSFAGAAGDEVSIELAGMENDPVLYLYGPKTGASWSEATPIAYNDDTNGLDSYLELALPQDGEYLILVREYWGDAGGFRLSIDGEGTVAPAECAVAPISPTTIDTGSGPSLAVDAVGGLHVSYTRYDSQSSGVRPMYAYRPAGGAWQTRVLSNSGLASGTSIAVDAAGGVHIGFCLQIYNPELYYVYLRRATSTETPALRRVDWSCRGPVSLQVDPNRGVHIAYEGPAPSGGVRYAYAPSGGGFTTEVVDSTSGLRAWPSLARDADGGIHISYYQSSGSFDSASTDYLSYAYRPRGGVWARRTITGVSRLFRDASSIAVDDAGVHIAYYETTNSDLGYAYKPAGGSWTMASVDTQGTTGRYPALALDALGGVNISYVDAGNGALRYAHAPRGGAWAMGTIEANSSAAVIATDTAGRAHVAYQQGEVLRHAEIARCP